MLTRQRTILNSAWHLAITALNACLASGVIRRPVQRLPRVFPGEGVAGALLNRCLSRLHREQPAREELVGTILHLHPLRSHQARTAEVAPRIAAALALL